MPFLNDEALVEEVGEVYGRYVATFMSEHGEVRADIFEEVGDQFVAHVSFPTGLDGATVSDPYVSALHQYARENGFADKLRLVYAE